MPLAPGDKLGPYEILSTIGKGGMGEVFRAHDSRLQREVAIKTSATQFSERFEREARAIAALNHPNICTLFDVGPNYLVMEFVEGESLQASIQSGPIPLDTALHYARQVASALEAAHEKAITHRDLKPGNIMIKPDGSVKVLDFGLAKFGGNSPTAISEDSPTLSMAATQAGTILGTAAYMAPEQARGKQVDKRADIWAFGVVLHEMLTGQRTFKGEDLTETMAAVVMKDPDLAPIPHQVRRLVKKCLAKDPAKRLRDIGDAWELLDAEPVEIQAAPPPSPAPASKTPWAVAGGAVFALVALAAWTFYPRPAPAPPDTVRFTLAPPQGARITNNRAAAAQLAVSPDGRYVAFVADGTGEASSNRVLWVRALGSLDAQKLDKTEGAMDPFWSPDSKNLGFFADSKLKRISVSGGSPINLADADLNEGGAWSQPEGQSEGVILFVPNASAGIQRVPATGGVPTPVTKLAKDEASHTYPQFLPDGKRFIYHVRGGSKQGIYLSQLGSDQRTFLVDTIGRARFAPPDFLLFLRDNTLLAQHVDWDAGKPLGEPVSVTDEVRAGGANTRNAFSVSSNGVLAYRRGNTGTNQYHWYTRDGKPDGLPLAAGATNGGIELSPDNKRAVFVVQSGGATDLWLMEFPSGVISRLTSDAGSEGDPVWSPDSRRIAFLKSEAANGKRAIYQMLIGSGKDSLVYPEATGAEMWTREGLVGRLNNAIFLIPAPEENATSPIAEKPRILIEPKYQVDQFRVSPDGKWVAYRSRESGTDEVWVATFPGFADRRKVSAGAGIQPLWRAADSKELTFVLPAGALQSVDVKIGATFEAGVPKALFRPPGFLLGNVTYHQYAMSGDGKRFLILESPDSGAEIEPLYLILNWPSQLGK